MKAQLFAFLSFAVSCFAVFGEAVTNEVLFVNEKGEVVLAADLAVIPFGKNVYYKADKNGAVTDLYVMLDKDGKMADVSGLEF